MTLYEVLQLKFPNTDFTKDIILQDDGDGVYIKEWNIENDPLPSQSIIGQWVIELDLKYRQKLARESRVYPSWQVQEDMKYHDAIDGTTTWIDAITAIKLTHPIPEK
jgi:hypothetical protein